MKKMILPLTALSFALAACGTDAEEQVEGAYEEKADNLEEKADNIREEADAKADALDEKADQVEELSDEMGDRVEAGTLDKSEAMPGNVIDNDSNKLQEVVE